ncbi:hypothetical protein SCHPADRAFT_946668, partial [Schizopora paradoxa]
IAIAQGRLTHFADVCLTRSKHLPLTLGVDISLKHSRSAHPLIFALATHEARWSRFSIQFLLAELFPSSEDGNDNIILKDPCGGSLQEFSHNVYPWIIHSGSEILQDLETLRLRIVGHTTRQEQIASDLTVPEITKSLSPAPHLKELDLMVNVCDWVSEYEQGPQILLLELQVLTSTPHLLPYLTCPALEKYTLVYVGDSYPRIILQDFVERSACPLHTLTFMDPLGLLYPPNARECLIPRITSLVVVSPAEMLLYIVPPKGGEEFLDVLPSLEHLELHDIKSFSFDLVFNFITFRWDLGASNRTLKSVKLVRCFESIPEALFNPEGGIDLAVIDEKWRELARCVNEGLLLSR